MNNVSYLKNLRKTILDLHYKKSGGDKFFSVMTHDLAKDLGFTDWQNQDYQSALQYLSDSGFIYFQDNVNTGITTDGINEVENSYPNLSGEIIESGGNLELVHKLITLRKESDRIVDFDLKGILERSRLHSFDIYLVDEINKFISKTDEETQLKFKKITSGWRNMPKPGFTNPGDAEKQLKSLLEFIDEAIERFSGKKFEKEAFIGTGKPYEGRQQLLHIFSTAKDEIFIVDSYLSRKILSILSTSVENNSNLKLKFLLGSKNKEKFDGFVADVPDFTKQYNLKEVKVRVNKDLHDRFIIIDHVSVYTVGSSLDELGNKGNSINLIEGALAVKSHTDDILSKWANSDDLLS